MAADGLESEVRKVAMAAGPNQALNLSLRPTEKPRVMLEGYRAQAEALPYDQVYPAGPGRDVLERTCMVCHGEDFVSSTPPTWRHGRHA